MKIETLFPVQKKIIPLINNVNGVQSVYPNDMCVCAPTGSGKTLAYVLPIIDNLCWYIRPAPRALILLPVADLAEQVYNVVQKCLSGEIEVDASLHSIVCPNRVQLRPGYSRPLRAMLLSNKNSLAKEQARLIDEDFETCTIDILVCTPGRLVDHIENTEGLDLSELRFLVLDECDRIIETIKQNWLDELNEAVFGKSGRLILDDEHLNVYNVFYNPERRVPLQKLLFSATLARDPEKLEQLKLFMPLYFNFGKNGEEDQTKETKKEDQPKSLKESTEQSSEKEPAKIETKPSTSKSQEISIPSELKECYIRVDAQQKPLVTIYLIKTLKMSRMLCFVKTKESAKRLNKLLQYNEIASLEFSASLHAARRTRVKKKFEEGKCDVLVCSDVMARGMDLANVECVLLYDAAFHMNSYVHKVGRTARAGHQGTSIALLERNQVHAFKQTLNNIEVDHFKKLTEIKVKEDDLAHLTESYTASLAKLKDEFEDQE